MLLVRRGPSHPPTQPQSGWPMPAPTAIIADMSDSAARTAASPRIAWDQVPKHVRRCRRGRARLQGGHRPDPARRLLPRGARVVCADGTRAFVKACGSPLNPTRRGCSGPRSRRSSCFPRVPHAGLLAAYDDGAWVARLGVGLPRRTVAGRAVPRTGPAHPRRPRRRQLPGQSSAHPFLGSHPLTRDVPGEHLAAVVACMGRRSVPGRGTAVLWHSTGSTGVAVEMTGRRREDDVRSRRRAHGFGSGTRC